VIRFRKTRQGHFTIRGCAGLIAGTAGRASNCIDYSPASNPSFRRSAEKALVAGLCGLPGQRILFLDQVHGASVLRVHEANDLPVVGSADAMITGTPGLCLVIRTADCVPLLLFDAENSVLCAVHAGWRGCRSGIAEAAVQRMLEDYGSNPGQIQALLLPCIGPDSYVVQEDVADYFPRHVLRRYGQLFLDLRGFLARSLQDAGIRKRHLFIAPQCTFRDNRDFFSHRRGDFGRNLNFSFMPAHG
jgi:hypothetical protein